MLSGFQLLIPLRQLCDSCVQQIKKLETDLSKCDSHGRRRRSCLCRCRPSRSLGVATGKMAAKVLKGAKPADTAVDIFDKGKSVINTKNAKNSVSTVPEDALKEAGQVIK